MSTYSLSNSLEWLNGNMHRNYPLVDSMVVKSTTGAYLPSSFLLDHRSHKKQNHIMPVVFIIIGIVAGGGVAVWLTTTVLRNKLLAKSQQVLKDAEVKGEVLKKEKELQAKEKFLQLQREHDKRVNEQNNKMRDAENKLKQREQTLNQKVDELQKKSEEYQKEQANLLENVRARREQELNDLYTRLQQSYQDNQAALQKAQAEKMSEISEKVLAAVKKLGEDGGYVYIVDTSSGVIPYVSTTLSTDITAQVKKELGIQ